jgi:hypothetical protein
MWMQVCITKHRHYVSTLNDYRHLNVQVHAEVLNYN